MLAARQTELTSLSKLQLAVTLVNCCNPFCLEYKFDSCQFELIAHLKHFAQSETGQNVKKKKKKKKKIVS